MAWLSCDKISATGPTKVMTEPFIEKYLHSQHFDWPKLFMGVQIDETMLLVLHLRYTVLREKLSIAVYITKPHLISLWLPPTCHSASEPGTWYFLLIINVPWVVRLRISTGSTRLIEDLTRPRVTFTLFPLRCPFILWMPRFGNLNRI